MRYRAEMRRTLEATSNLHLLRQGKVVDFVISHGRLAGVVLEDGREFGADAVVVATGTFLNGLIHTGRRTYSGGRAGEPASIELSETLSDWISRRAVENGNASETGRQNHRLELFRATAGRPRAGSVFIFDRHMSRNRSIATSATQRTRFMTRFVRTSRSRRSIRKNQRGRPAILSFYRRQGREVF